MKRTITFLAIATILLCCNTFMVKAFNYPKVETSPTVKNIGLKTATVFGEITEYGDFTEVYRSFWYQIKGAPISTAKIILVKTVGFSVTFTDLLPGTTYEFYAAAGFTNGFNGGEVRGELKEFTTLPDKNPPAISNKTITVVAKGADFIRIKWQKATDNCTSQEKLKYILFWSIDGTDDRARKDLTDADSYIIEGLKSNTNYKITLSVYDESSNSNIYSSVTTKTTADKNPPAVSNKTITVGTIKENSVAISWNKATDDVTPQSKLIYSYAYQAGHNQISYPSHNETIGTNITSGTITGLLPGQKYTIFVSVRDLAGNYAYYNDVNITTLPENKPPTVSNKTITIGTITANSVTISWDKATDDVTPQNKLVYSYGYQVGHNQVSYPSHNGGEGTNISSVTITGLSSETDYTLFLSVGDGGKGTSYNQVNVTTKSADDQSPTVSNKTITVGTVTDKSITLSWTKASDNVTPQSKLRYCVYYATREDVLIESILKNKPANAGGTLDINDYTLSGLSPATTYHFIVTVEDEAGNMIDYTQGFARTTEATVTVPVTGVTLNKTSLTLEVYRTETLVETVAPATATNKAVTWKSSNTGVATVDASGKVSGRKAGTATITVATADGSKTATCAVTVQDTYVIPAITSANNASVANGTGGTFAVTATGTGPFKWALTGSVPAGVTINSSTGLITIAATTAVGTHAFSIKVDGAKGHDMQHFTLTVTEPSPTAIPVSGITRATPPAVTFAVGKTTALDVTVVPATATDKMVYWTSSDESIATVSSTGVVTGINTGTVIITATTRNGGKAVTFNVTVRSSSVGNDNVEKTAVWSAGNSIYIRLHDAETIRIYNLTGALVKALPDATGEHCIPLPRGIYIVRTKTTSEKVVIK